MNSVIAASRILCAVVIMLLAVPTAPPARAGGGVNPCSLLTVQEAAQAMGRPAKAVVSKTKTNPIGQRICFWDVPDDSQMRFVQVSLVCTSAMPKGMTKSGYNAARLFADSKKLLGRPPAAPGLGREAFWGGSGLKAGAGLHVLAGECYFTVSAAGGAPGQALPRAKKLAAKILSRLK